MHASKQLFQNRLLSPLFLENLTTSNLISEGGLCSFLDSSAPCYLPYGHIILDNITNVVNIISSNHDIVQITVPSIMKNEVLSEGEVIDPGFAEKIVGLAGRMENYHLLFTPEPFIHNQVNAELLSYRQLPIRVCYHADVFRAITDPKGILKSRQFRTFMGNSIDADLKSVEDSLSIFTKISEEIFDSLGVPVKLCNRPIGINIEFYYFGSEGEELFIPELNPTSKITCLSLAMAYHYSPFHNLSAQYQDRTNKKHSILMTTYGLGIQRLFYAVLDAHRDKLGFNLPQRVRPFDYSVVPRNDLCLEYSQTIYQHFCNNSVRVLFDDRVQYSKGRRLAFADFIGVPYKVIVEESSFYLATRSGKRSESHVLNTENIAKIVQYASDF